LLRLLEVAGVAGVTRRRVLRSLVFGVRFYEFLVTVNMSPLLGVNPSREKVAPTYLLEVVDIRPHFSKTWLIFDHIFRSEPGGDRIFDHIVAGQVVGSRPHSLGESGSPSTTRCHF